MGKKAKQDKAPSMSGPKGQKSRSGSGAKLPGTPADEVLTESSPAVRKPPNAGKKPVNRATGEWAGPGSGKTGKRCTAKSQTTGERCKRAPLRGAEVCTSHGAAAPQIKAKAKERLLALLDPALAALHKVLTDPGADDSVKVRAALGILDRGGYGPGSKIEVGVTTPWESMLTEVLDPANLKVDRSSLGPSKQPPALGDGGGADPLGIEDVEQHSLDAQSAAWAKHDAEDEQPYATRLDRFGPGIVRGEVIASRDDGGPLPPPPPAGPSEFGGRGSR